MNPVDRVPTTLDVESSPRGRGESPSGVEEGSTPGGRAARGDRRGPFSDRLLLLVGASLVVLGVVVFAFAVVRPGPAGTDALTGDSGALAGTAAVDAGTWQVENGEFRLVDGVVSLAFPPELRQARAAFVPTGQPTVISSRLIDVSANAGLLFRFQDSRNFWSVVATPGFGTWNIYRVVDGRVAFVANTDLGLSEGSTLLEVRLDASEIAVYVNGRFAQRVFSEVLQTARGVGIGAGPADAVSTQWTSFTAVTS